MNFRLLEVMPQGDEAYHQGSLSDEERAKLAASYLEWASENNRSYVLVEDNGSNTLRVIRRYNTRVESVVSQLEMKKE